MLYEVTDKHGDVFEVSYDIDLDLISDFMVAGRQRNRAFDKARRDGFATTIACGGGVLMKISYVGRTGAAEG